MKRWLVLIRGSVGMGLAWAAAWACVGVIVGSLEWLDPGGPGLLAELIEGVGGVLVPGFMFGSIFSVVLATAERRRTFEEMSLPRFAAWGGVAGAILSLILGGVGNHSSVWDDVANAVVLGAMGAGSAVATLALARRANSLVRSGESARCVGDGSVQETD